MMSHPVYRSTGRSRVCAALRIAFLFGQLQLLLLSASATFAADPVFRGYVLDSVTKLPIEGAEVTLDENGAGAPFEFEDDSSPLGVFDIPDIAPGTYDIGASHPGYLPYLDEDMALATDDEIDRIIELSPRVAETYFDVFVEVRGVQSGVALSGVPVRIYRFTNAAGTDTPEEIVRTTDSTGRATFRGMTSGYYRFRVNNSLDGSNRPKWEAYNTMDYPANDLRELTQPHTASVLLKPIPQDLTVRVKGFDPVDETDDTPLEGFYVELTGLDPNDTDSEVVPTRVGTTNDSGEVLFSGLPAIPWKVVAKRNGYEPEEDMVTPGGGGALPASPYDVFPTYIPHDVLVFLDLHPYEQDDPGTPEAEDNADFLFYDVPATLEGIEGTNTEGITRTVSINGDPAANAFLPFTDPQDVRIFEDVLPGRYRVRIAGQSDNTGFGEPLFGFFPPFIKGEIFVETDPGFMHDGAWVTTAPLPINVEPAVIRGRIFVAEEISDVEVEGVYRPIYVPRQEGNIQFIEFYDDVADYNLLKPEFQTVVADADQGGEFRVELPPGRYGVRLPDLTGYTGNHAHIKIYPDGATLQQGWPMPEEWPFAPGIPPSNGAGLPGSPLTFESGKEYVIDLFLRKAVGTVEGQVDADPDDPSTQMLVYRVEESVTVTTGYSDIGQPDVNDDIGKVILTPTGGGTPIMSDLFQIGSTSNAGYRVADVPPGTYTVTASHLRNTFDSTTVTVPEWPEPGVTPSVDPATHHKRPLFPAITPGGLPIQATFTAGTTSLDFDYYQYDFGDEVYNLVQTVSGANYTYIELPYINNMVFVLNAGLATKLPPSAFTFWTGIDDGYLEDAVAANGATKTVRINTSGPEKTLPNNAGRPTPAFELTTKVVGVGDPTFRVPDVTVDWGDGVTYTSNGSTDSVIASFTRDPQSFTATHSTDDWIYVTQDLEMVDINPLKLSLTIYMRRALKVEVTVMHSDGSAPSTLETASVVVRDRFGNVEATLDFNPDTDKYGMGTPFDSADAHYVDITAPGYMPSRTRISAADAVDEDGTLLVSLTKSLDALPLPTISALRLNRAGLFLPGVNKTGTVDDYISGKPAAQDALTLTWEADVRAADAFDITLPEFDSAIGEPGAPHAESVTDPVTDIYLIDRRSFSADPNTTDVPSSDHVPLNTAQVVLQEWLSNIRDGTIPHVFHQRLHREFPNTIGETATAEGSIDLTQMPPGDFDPVVVAVSQRGAIKLYDSFSYPSEAHTLKGARIPQWMSFATEIIGGAKAFKTVQGEVEDIYPDGKYLPLPEFIADISLDGENPGFLNYEYGLAVTWKEGMDTPGSGLLNFAPGVLGVEFNTEMTFGAKGFDNEVFLRSDASIYGESDLGDSLPKILPEDTEATGFARIVASTTTSQNYDTSKPYELELETGLDLDDDGNPSSVGMDIEFPLRPVLSKLPYVGPVLLGLDETGALVFTGNIRGAVGLTSLTTWRTEFPESRESGSLSPAELADVRVNRRSFLGGLERDWELNLFFNFGLGIGADLGGEFVQLDAGFDLTGNDSTGVSYVLVEINTKADWPLIKRISGGVTAHVEISSTTWFWDLSKRWEWDLLEFEHEFGTDPEFYLVPMEITEARVEVSGLPSVAFNGGSETVIEDFVPFGDYAVTAGATEALLFLDVNTTTDQMILKMVTRSGANFGSPLAITEADMIVDATMQMLPDGRWLAVWTELDNVNASDLTPPSTVRYSLSDAGGANWSTPADVAALTGVGEDLRLVIGSSLTGLVILENTTGPQSNKRVVRGATFNGSTWSSVSDLLSERVIRAFDAVGPGKTGTGPAQLAYLDDMDQIHTLNWTGSTASSPALLGAPTEEFSGIDIALGPDDTHYLAGTLAAGGANLYRNIANAGWTSLSGLFSSLTMSHLALGYLPDGTEPGLILAWTAGGNASEIHYAFTDDAGILTHSPLELTSTETGNFSKLTLVPDDDLTATLFARYRGSSELRQYEITRPNGVTLVADTPQAEEFRNVPGKFTVARPADDLSAALTVNYEVDAASTATATADYTALPGSVTIPAGEVSAEILVIPVTDETAEGPETVILNLLTGSGYTIDPNFDTATVTILDRPIHDWKFRELPSPNDPSAGDLEDLDLDTTVHLVEYGLHLDPEELDIQGLPKLSIYTETDGKQYLMLTYTRAKEATDVEFLVEVSPTLGSGSWKSGYQFTKEIFPRTETDDTVTIRTRSTTPITEEIAEYMRLTVRKQ